MVHYIKFAKPRKRSWYSDESLYNLRIKERFGHLRLNQITRHQLQTFHTDLLASGLAPATCDHYLKLIKHVYNLAIDWELYSDKNPASRIPLFRIPNAVQTQLSDEQIRTLLQTLKADKNRLMADVVTVLLGSGARVSEVLKAKWVHIDRVNRRWHVPAENSKSKKPRIIEITDVVLDVINSLKTEGKYEYLFVTKSGRPASAIRKPWLRVRAKAGLPHLRLHDCRHLFITWILEANVSLHQAAQLAGHLNPVTTQRYSHLSKNVLQNAANNASLKLRSVMQSPPQDSVIKNAPDGSSAVIDSTSAVTAPVEPAAA
jgi:integrase